MSWGPRPASAPGSAGADGVLAAGAAPWAAKLAATDPCEVWRRRASARQQRRDSWGGGPTPEAQAFGRSVGPDGVLAVNDLPLSVEELSVLAESIGHSRGLRCLRLKCSARGGGGGGALSAEGAQKRRQRRAAAAAAAAALSMQNERVYRRLARPIATLCRASNTLVELEVGYSLGPHGMASLGKALSSALALRRLSFSGAAIGDAGFGGLVEGLRTNQTLEDLILTGCSLTDASGAGLASILRAHATRRAVTEWQDGLRSYPALESPGQAPGFSSGPASMPRGAAPLAQQRGLMHLDASDNFLTHKAVKALCTALDLDARCRTIILQRNRLGNESVEAFHELMRYHPSLEVVDLRHNKGRPLGLLRTERSSVPSAVQAPNGVTFMSDGEGTLLDTEAVVGTVVAQLQQLCNLYDAEHLVDV